MEDHSRSFWEVVEGIVNVPVGGGGSGVAGSSGPRPAAHFGKSSDCKGLSSVHICTLPEPRHYIDVISELGTETKLPVRRCRDFAAEKFEYTPGGNFVRLRGRRHTTPPGQSNCRGVITKFTHQSQRRLMELVNSIDRGALDVQRMAFVTLTYPAAWPTNPMTWKKHLHAFSERVRRAFGPTPIIWKLEAQRRGAPHYHMIAYMSEVMTAKAAKQLCNWVAQAWYEIAADGDEKHLLFHKGELGNGNKPCVEPIRSWEGVSAYASKYLGKTTQFIHPSLVTSDGEPISIGRLWGVWHRDGWPINHSEIFAPSVVVNRVRRNIRRYVENKGYKHERLRKNCPFTAFVPAAIVERIIWHEILTGYGLEAFERWRIRRGLPEPIDPHQEYHDWLSECGAEYSQNNGTTM